MSEERIVRALIAEAQRLGLDAERDEMMMQRLEQAARLAADELQSARSTRVNLPFLGATERGPVHLDVQLSAELVASGSGGSYRDGAVLDPRIKIR